VAQQADTPGDAPGDPIAFIERYGALARCLRSLAAQAYATAEMGSTQAKFLRHIGEQSQISQAELARATGTDPTLTGRALQTLIERGWVRRRRSDEDRREYILALGAAGRRARGRVEKLRATLAARVVATLDARDLQDFERITGKILAAFDVPTERSRGPGIAINRGAGKPAPPRRRVR
jgi:DNA-binding MarR family transcriptional regulator